MPPVCFTAQRMSFASAFLLGIRQKILPAQSFEELSALIALLLLAGSLGSANAAELAHQLSSGDHTITLSHGGRERSAIVHVPSRAVEKRNISVVMNFYGGGGHASNKQEYSFLVRPADRQEFVAGFSKGHGGIRQRALE